MMLCSLGGFVFKLKESEYERLRKKLIFNYAKRDRIALNPTYHSVRGWEEEFEFSGQLVVKHDGSLEPLINIAKGKKPVQLTFATGESEKVIIQEIEQTKKTFFDNGRAIFIEFKVKVSRYEA